MTENNHLKQDVQNLVNGYIKRHAIKLYIPICINKIILLFISLFDYVLLFNYGYLGEDHLGQWQLA